MKKGLLILLCLPMIGFGQQTYVPDDVFEEYIELNFPLADNGIVNDDYVLTAGLDLTSSGGLFLGLTPSTSSILDLTGIEDFTSMNSLQIQNLNITTIDLSLITLKSWYSSILIESCPLVTDIILPSDSFSLILKSNTYLTNIVFHPYTFMSEFSYITQCNSLTSIDMSNISGVYNGATLQLSQNLNLTQVNLKNGFGYNWGIAMFSSNPNLFCIQVDDPNYSSISANWNWFDHAIDPIQYSYSTNCGWPSAIEEQTTSKEIMRTINILGRKTKSKKNTPLFYLFDDGTVEKKIILE